MFMSRFQLDYKERQMGMKPGLNSFFSILVRSPGLDRAMFD